MVQQVRFLIEGRALTVDRRVVEVSVYVRNLLRNLVDNDDSSSDSGSSSGSDSGSDSDSDVGNGNGNGLSAARKHRTAASSDKCVEIPLDNISYDTMELILRWCKHYYESHKDEIEQGYPYSAMAELSVSDERESSREAGDLSINPTTTTTSATSEVGNWPDNVMDDYQAKVSGPVLDMWEREFLDVDAETLKSIILASNFLNIRPLLDTACKIIAELFRGKSPREIINAFNAARVQVNSAANASSPPALY